MEQLSQDRLSFLEEIGRHMDRMDAAHAYHYYQTWKDRAFDLGMEQIGRLIGQLADIWQQAIEGSTGNQGDIDEAKLRYDNAYELSELPLRQLELERELRMKELTLFGQERTDAQDDFSRGHQRVLIVDDDPILCYYLAQSLRMEGYKTEEAATVSEAKLKLRETTYHLVTLDLVMSTQSGFELFEFMKGDPSLKWIPLVVLSGNNDVNEKVRCFRLGADDYVLKPFHMEELVARIKRTLERTNDFAQMAFRDPLTGIYNRRFMDNQLDLELKRTQRYMGGLSLGFIDIDRFKKINDSYGHHVGDLVLQGLAHKLVSALRGSDFVGRFGGEEFIVVMPKTSANLMREVLEGVLRSVREQPIANYEGEEIFITFSAGVAEFDGQESIAQWIARADAAMYRAKQDGRNRIYLYSSEDEHQQIEVRKPSAVIIDDDEMLRSILVTLMQTAGFVTVEAGDAEAGEALLTAAKYDIGLFDMTIPKGNGLALLAAVKGNPNSLNFGMKTILLSANRHETDIARAFELGVDDCVFKPFSLVELESKVKRLMEAGAIPRSK